MFRDVLSSFCWMSLVTAHNLLQLEKKTSVRSLHQLESLRVVQTTTGPLSKTKQRNRDRTIANKKKKKKKKTNILMNWKEQLNARNIIVSFNVIFSKPLLSLSREKLNIYINNNFFLVQLGTHNKIPCQPCFLTPFKRISRLI